MKTGVFQAAEILLPKDADMEKWAVIACDQFTSDETYWQRVREKTADVPSSLHLILPEAELGSEHETEQIKAIHQTMQEYLNQGIFASYPDSYLYVERTMENGMIRKGLIGAVDLDAYEYESGAVSPIRATERTVAERIPPRQRVRNGAALELPHVLLLCDDDRHSLIEPVSGKKKRFTMLYDFDLMEDGGHISGWLVDKETAREFEKTLEIYEQESREKYSDLDGEPMLFAVGDGNHSLATAKSCYEALKRQYPDRDLSQHPARYALVELENIHDPSLAFEPIHRAVFRCDPKDCLQELKQDCCSKDGYPVKWQTAEQSGVIYLDPAKGELAVGILQDFLDRYLKQHTGEIDYIHDDDALLKLAQHPDTIGFLLPAMKKSQLFRGVIADGALPRKTFSMGHSREKRYYIEARKIL